MKRKLKVKNLIILILSVFLLVFSITFLIRKNKKEVIGDIKPIEVTPLSSFLKGKKISEVVLSPEEIKGLDIKKLIDEDYISMKGAKELDMDLYSEAYMLVDLDNRDVLYVSNSDEERYPASLTKLLTLDTVLNLYNDDLNETSYLSSYQRGVLIQENASLAYIKADTEYTVRDLLYALILPSGGDAAVALGNLFIEDGLDLVEEMNKQASRLGLIKTNVFNTTGLHNDSHVMSINDLFVVAWDILKFDEGKKVLSSFEYELEDGIKVKSTLSPLKDIEKVEVLGGKTGFTGQAGENIFVYYLYNNHPYMLILMNADGNPYAGELYHFDDVINIFNKLY